MIMNTIDLHGYRYEDAKRKLELFINSNWGCRMKVITGNSEAMKNVVCSILNIYDLEFERNSFLGYITIIEH
jgi:DNA-nicking Smr family endonuclease